MLNNEPIKLTEDDPKQILFHGFRAVALAVLTGCAVIVIVLSGVGEFIALQCLYSETAQPLQHQVVLLSVLVLTIGTAAFILVRIYVRIYAAKYRVFRLFVEQLSRYTRTMLAQGGSTPGAETHDGTGNGGSGGEDHE